MGKSKLLFILISLASAFTFANDQDPQVVAAVDFSRYAGTWYEIAHMPNAFQKNCVRSTAQYEVKSENEVALYNTCFYSDGAQSAISGKAYTLNKSEPAKLKVEFNPFLVGDYWIIDLDPDYQWAVVSAPMKKSLFLLSRQAPMNATLMQRILFSLVAKGFKTEDLVFDQYD